MLILKRRCSQHLDLVTVQHQPDPWEYEWIFAAKYRHLEIMDDITLMLHEGRLPFSPVGDMQNWFIKQYQLAFGLRKKLSSLPGALTWDSLDLVAEEPEVGSWQLRNTEKKGRKRKQGEEAVCSAKKPKLANSHQEHEPVLQSLTWGVVWDPVNWSCAYDSVVVSLYWLWFANVPVWTVVLPAINRDILPHVMATFVPAVTDNEQLHVSRATLRLLLFASEPGKYRWGQHLVSLDSVLERITRSDRVIYRINTRCPTVHCEFHQVRDVYCPVLDADEGGQALSGPPYNCTWPAIFAHWALAGFCPGRPGMVIQNCRYREQ